MKKKTINIYYVSWGFMAVTTSHESAKRKVIDRLNKELGKEVVKKLRRLADSYSVESKP